MASSVDLNELTSIYDIVPSLVHRRGIYKDVYRSRDQFTDYQLRPNQCVAMAVVCHRQASLLFFFQNSFLVLRDTGP